MFYYIAEKKSLIFQQKEQNMLSEEIPKNGFLKIYQNSQKNTCARVSFLKKLPAEACNFIKEETLPQDFFCEFLQIFQEHLSL